MMSDPKMLGATFVVALLIFLTSLIASMGNIEAGYKLDESPRDKIKSFMTVWLYALGIAIIIIPRIFITAADRMKVTVSRMQKRIFIAMTVLSAVWIIVSGIALFKINNVP